MRNRLPAALLTACLALAVLFVCAAPAVARDAPAPLPEIALAELPVEGREVYARIHRGGPFRYDRDGVVFGNRERILPAKARGHYREYTVRTPGTKSRGARRIVCGGAPTAPEACYYTDDHYRSFKRIRE
ncbi:MAG: ribonuclease [Betaproteobacteria bacterium]|nr:ribonuclease [Betaproteobacteria bacterium]